MLRKTNFEIPVRVSFAQSLQRENIKLIRDRIDTLQVNVGKLCNQACNHCHVEAGPKRTEIMDRSTVERLLHLLHDAPQVETLDITGGAPELNPNFRHFVRETRAMGKEVIDRCNLTVLLERGQGDTAEFLAGQAVQVVASLPCYSRENVNEQRGKGVFGRSIRALRRLNELGYGAPDSGLKLHLVYNPVGTHLPPEQTKLKADYQYRLREDFGIVFNDLFTITNMPIKRFAHMLEASGQLDAYMQLLLDNFNPAAAAGVMCRNLISVGWDGRLYDCDFNQMLEIPLNRRELSIWDIEQLANVDCRIAIDNHCYGCTAGAGSSCGGSLV